MSKTLPLSIVLTVAAVVFAFSPGASGSPAAVLGPLKQSPGPEVVAAGSFIAAIKDAKTSIIRGEPKCGNGTTLQGALVMETPQRVGFPFTATTFASPRGTFTTLTTTGDESEAVIQEVARTLNSRADDYVRKLLRNCSL